MDTCSLMMSWALIDENNKVLGCFGVAPQWPGRAQVWSVLDEDIGVKGLLIATRHVIDYFDELQKDSKYARLEATTGVDFKNGNKWLNG